MGAYVAGVTGGGGGAFFAPAAPTHSRHYSGASPRTPAPQTPEGLNTLRPGPTHSARPAFEDEAVQADSGGLGAAAPRRDGNG